MTKRDISVYVGLWLTGIIFILLKGYFMEALGSRLLDLDLIIIIIAFIYLKYGPAWAGCYAFGQGLFTDIFSGGLQGLFITLYMAVFGVILLSALIFNLNNPKGQAIVVIVSMMVKKILLFIILLLVSVPFSLSKPMLSIFLLSVVLTGLSAPLVYYILNSIRFKLLSSDGNSDSGLVMNEQEI